MFLYQISHHDRWRDGNSTIAVNQDRLLLAEAFLDVGDATHEVLENVDILAIVNERLDSYFEVL